MGKDGPSCALSALRICAHRCTQRGSASGAACRQLCGLSHTAPGPRSLSGPEGVGAVLPCARPEWGGPGRVGEEQQPGPHLEARTGTVSADAAALVPSAAVPASPNRQGFEGDISVCFKSLLVNFRVIFFTLEELHKILSQNI